MQKSEDFLWITTISKHKCNYNFVAFALQLT